MYSTRDQTEEILSDLFSNLSIGETKTRIAYHTVYNTYGYDLSSPFATSPNASQMVYSFTSLPGDGISYSFYSDDFFEQCYTELMSINDRSEAPNIYLVIWDGDNAVNVTNLPGHPR